MTCALDACDEPVAIIARLQAGDITISVPLCSTHETELDNGDLGFVAGKTEVEP